MGRVAVERSKLTTQPRFFLSEFFFEDTTSAVDLFLNDSFSTHSRIESCFESFSNSE